MIKVYACIAEKFSHNYQKQNQENSAVNPAVLPIGIPTGIYRIKVLHLLWFVLIVENPSTHTVEKIANIVVASATSMHVLGRFRMTKSQLEREINYGVHIALLKELLQEHIITQQEFDDMEKIYLSQSQSIIQNISSWKSKSTRQKT